MELVLFVFGVLRSTLFYVSVSFLLPGTIDNALSDKNWDGANQGRLDD